MAEKVTNSRMLESLGLDRNDEKQSENAEIQAVAEGKTTREIVGALKAREVKKRIHRRPRIVHVHPVIDSELEALERKTGASMSRIIEHLIAAQLGVTLPD